MVLAEFVEQCRELVAGDAPETAIAAATRDLMASFDELRGKVDTVGDRDPLLGGEVTLFEDDTLTIMVLDTPPGVVQPPHGHSMTAVIGVFDGAEEHRLYRRAGERAELSGTKSVGPGETLVLGPEAIHAINAGAGSWARAIHVYLGSISTAERPLFNPDTLVAEPMDLERYAQYCRAA